MTDDLQARTKFRWMWVISIPIGMVLLIPALYLYILITMPDVSVLKNSNPETTALIEARKITAQEEGKKYSSLTN